MLYMFIKTMKSAACRCVISGDAPMDRIKQQGQITFMVIYVSVY